MSRRALIEAQAMFADEATARKLLADTAGRVNYAERNKADLEAGRHPANGLKLCPDLGKCGDCAFHVVRRFGKTYHKCEQHRLGTSRSEASDIRVSWPACELFRAACDTPEHAEGGE